MTHSNNVHISNAIADAESLGEGLAEDLSEDLSEDLPDDQAEDLSEALSIRDFARDYDHDEALVRRAMREISVRGISQGRGRPTLLSVEDQDRLLDHIEGPQEDLEEDPEEDLDLDEEDGEDSDFVSESEPEPEPGPEPGAGQALEPEPEFYASEAYASQDYGFQEEESEDYDAQVYEADFEESGPSISEAYESDAEYSGEEALAGQALAEPRSPSPFEVPPSTATPPLAPPQKLRESMEPTPRNLARYEEHSVDGRDEPFDNEPYPPSYREPYEPPQLQTGHYSASHPTDYSSSYRREHLEISPGNHRLTVETPEIPRAYDLAQFRSEETVHAIADPAEVVGQAMAAIDSLVSGMDADIRQQRNQLSQTQEAARALRIKAKQLHKKQIEYMIQSSAIGQAQQRCTTDLQEALGEVQALGKSPRSEPEPPSS